MEQIVKLLIIVAGAYVVWKVFAEEKELKANLKVTGSQSFLRKHAENVIIEKNPKKILYLK